MMRVLLDTNVLLDILLKPQPWVTVAEPIWMAHEAGRIGACVTASALTDVFYICRKIVGAASARELVRVCLENATILAVDREDLLRAYQSSLPDFEDALQLACALRHGLDAIITRDVAGFAGSSLPVLSPTDLIARLQSASPPPA